MMDAGTIAKVAWRPAASVARTWAWVVLRRDAAAD
jgi:hypothetical protein